MPIARVQMPDGRIARFEVAEGTPPEQVEAIAQEQFSGGSVVPEKGFGQKLNDFLGDPKDLPRQLGLTARYAVEGLGDTADFVASPARAAMNLLPGVNIQPGIGRNLANDMGLPEPQTPLERGIGGASRMVASGGGSIGLASRAAPLAQGTTQEVMKAFAAKPDAQLAALLGGGSAGAYVKETGGNQFAEIAASLAGAVAAPSVYQGAKSAANAVGNIANRGNMTANIDIRIDSALKPLGIKLSDLPMNVRTAMREDVEKAMKMGELSPDAVRRLADYRLLGATPTRGSLTLDPVTITNERNLAKMGANSSDPKLQQLAQTQNQNNRVLVNSMNTMGANQTDKFSAGQRVVGAIKNSDEKMRVAENALYAQAREAAGRDIPLDRVSFVNRADELLAQNNKAAFLPAEIRTLLNQISLGQVKSGGQTFDVPFNVNTIDQLKTTLATAHRGAQDGNVRAAISFVRQALDDAPIQRTAQQSAARAGFPNAIVTGEQAAKLQAMDQYPQKALDAFDAARAAARERRNWQESATSIADALDGVPPDRFVDNYIIGASNKASVGEVMKLTVELRKNPRAMESAKNSILAHLKERALNGSADEVGNFGQSAFNKSLKAIGDPKLLLFFSKKEVDQLKAIGRVASYEQFQPRGSAVNNSNSGALVAGLLDRIGNSSVLRKIPFGAELVANPAKNINLNIQSGRALNVPQGLLQAPVKQPPYRFLAPAVLPGLLAPAE